VPGSAVSWKWGNGNTGSGFSRRGSTPQQPLRKLLVRNNAQPILVHICEQLRLPLKLPVQQSQLAIVFIGNSPAGRSSK
jgi:hypothetical protein